MDCFDYSTLRTTAQDDSWKTQNRHRKSREKSWNFLKLKSEGN